jgi:hypothetical protein
MGDSTGGALLFTDDDVAGSVIVERIPPASSVKPGIIAQAGDKAVGPPGKLGNGIEIAAFASPYSDNCTDASSHCTPSRYN